MKLKHLFYLLIAASGWAITTLQSGCANIIPPTGGPRDSLPPVLVSANPVDSTKNFSGKKIVLTFNEFIQIDNPQQNLLVSPVPLVNPTIESKLRTVTVTIRDTLKPNTTYALDFGNAIKDVNEGNIYRNFTYLFSTGNHFDSLELGGRVTIAETGKYDSTIIVMLYKNRDDSAIIKERPRYIARTDSVGRFRFRFLEPGTFAIYAVKDEGGARRYQSKTALFAFYDSAVTTESQRKDIELYAFTEQDTSKKTVSTAVAPKKEKGKEPPKFIQVQNNLASNQLDLLTGLELSSDQRLHHFDSTKIHILADSLPAKGYSFMQDTSGRKIAIRYGWAENVNYTVIIDSTFAEDSIGRRLVKNDTLVFQTKRESEYGSVRLRFLNLPLEKKPLLLFVQGDNIKKSVPLKGRDFYERLFAPGEYELRIVYDTNGNGMWDTGSFFGKHLQPEKVVLVPRKVNVKANWDADIDITL